VVVSPWGRGRGVGAADAEISAAKIVDSGVIDWVQAVNITNLARISARKGILAATLII
jgi:hypothetical protein